MNRIYLTFANSRDKPLENLKEEERIVRDILNEREVKNHFATRGDSYAELSQVLNYLLIFRNHLLIFMYSGHANRDQLLLEDAPAHAKGIAKILGKCPNLKLVILNGCSTEGQVQQLHAEGVPVVVSTSAKVGDKAATQFASTFFKSFCELEKPLNEAFTDGLNAAQGANGEVTARSITFDSLEEDSDLPLWGISYANEVTENKFKNWKLPTQQDNSEIKANELLIDKIFTALAPFNTEVENIIADKAMGIIQEIDTHRELILKYLPFPISEQLRKLITPRSENQGEVFFDLHGRKRLEQVVRTYSITLEFVIFIMLSQLWDQLTTPENKNFSLKSEELTELEQLFKAENSVSYFVTLQRIRAFFIDHSLEPFIPAIHDLTENWENKPAFSRACLFIENVKKRLEEEGLSDDNSLSDNEAKLLSVLAEEELAAFFCEVCFLANYTMASINAIAVIKNRVVREPQFTHRLFRLIQQFEQKIKVNIETRHKPFNNNSVLLIRWNGDEKFNFRRLKNEDVLNLSPFIIDVNAFKEKTTITKLHFFDFFIKNDKSYLFKHAYKPDEITHITKSETHYPLLHQQFDSFSRLIFQKPIEAL